MTTQKLIQYAVTAMLIVAVLELGSCFFGSNPAREQYTQYFDEHGQMRKEPLDADEVGLFGESDSSVTHSYYGSNSAGSRSRSSSRSSSSSRSYSGGFSRGR